MRGSISEDLRNPEKRAPGRALEIKSQAGGGGRACKGPRQGGLESVAGTWHLMNKALVGHGVAHGGNIAKEAQWEV